MAGGRPTKYEPDRHPALAYEFCAENGFTDEKLAKAFRVNVATVQRWKKDYPEFCDAVKAGKDDFDTGKVEKSLLRRAKGFSYTEKTFEIDKSGIMAEVKRVRKVLAPDATSMIFWLKNRNSERWRDIQGREHTGKDGAPIDNRMTFYPPEPDTVEEWIEMKNTIDQQMKTAAKKRQSGE